MHHMKMCQRTSQHLAEYICVCVCVATPTKTFLGSETYRFLTPKNTPVTTAAKQPCHQNVDNTHHLLYSSHLWLRKRTRPVPEQHNHTFVTPTIISVPTETAQNPYRGNNFEHLWLLRICAQIVNWREANGRTILFIICDHLWLHKSHKLIAFN